MSISTTRTVYHSILDLWDENFLAWEKKIRDLGIPMGNRLRELREQKGLSQKKMGEILSLPKSSVSRLELGMTYPLVKTLVRYRNYFGVPIHWLVFGDEWNEGMLTDNLSLYLRNTSEKVITCILDILVLLNSGYEIRRKHEHPAAFPIIKGATQTPVLGKTTTVCPKELGGRLKELREKYSIPQTVLEDEFEIPPRTLCKYEKGDKDVPLKVLLSFTGCFGVTLDYLCFGEKGTELPALRRLYGFLNHASRDTQELAATIIQILYSNGLFG